LTSAMRRSTSEEVRTIVPLYNQFCNAVRDRSELESVVGQFHG
jgi:hypothetical protein